MTNVVTNTIMMKEKKKSKKKTKKMMMMIMMMVVDDVQHKVPNLKDQESISSVQGSENSLKSIKKMRVT